MYKFSVTQWIYGDEEIETSMKRLKKYHYDGIELGGEPYSTDLNRVSELLTKYKLLCTSICGIYNTNRDLSSSDETISGHAVRYVRDCVDMAAALGASHVIVVPTFVGKTCPNTTCREEWDNAVKNVREAGEYAKEKGVFLAIEALNRYETYLVTNMKTAGEFIRQVDIDSVKLMADLFHMNIEERSIHDALVQIAPHLIHVHIADNTREAAGWGRTDFFEVMQTLKDIGYSGPLTMEFLPSVANPYLAARQSGITDIYDAGTEQSINCIQNIINTISIK